MFLYNQKRFPSEWKGIRKKIYKTYTWEELLKALHKKNEQSLTASYEQLAARCTTNKDKYGRLSKHVLDQALDFMRRLLSTQKLIKKPIIHGYLNATIRSVWW